MKALLDSGLVKGSVPGTWAEDMMCAADLLNADTCWIYKTSVSPSGLWTAVAYGVARAAELQREPGDQVPGPPDLKELSLLRLPPKGRVQ